MAFTEVVCATGLTHNSGRTLFLLEAFDGERPTAAHLYGSDPAEMAAAAQRAAGLGRFDLIDINCGCPVRRVMARGAGAALMHKPERVRDIVRAVSAAVALPVTVKTRLGPRPGVVTAGQLADAVADGGGVGLFVHARYTTQLHQGETDLATLATVVRGSRVPVVANGSIVDAASALRVLRETGAAGVMIGRGAVGRPWVFAEVRAALSGAAPPAAPDDAALRTLIEAHLDLVHELRLREVRFRYTRKREPEAAAAVSFRAHLLRYLAGRRGSVAARRQLNEVLSLQDVRNMADAVLRV
jgi:nifR3 family TIM-barrel protein